MDKSPWKMASVHYIKNMKKIINKIKNKRNLKAFTLIETLISSLLFSFVCLISVATLFAIFNIDIKLKSTRTVYDNLNLVIEDMSREARQGQKYYCLSSSDVVGGSISIFLNFTDGKDCATTPGVGVVFLPEFGAKTDRFGYFWDGSSIVKQTIKLNSSYQINTFSTQRMTTPDLKINKLDVLISGTDSYANGDTKQPRIDFYIAGLTNSVPVLEFNIKNSISQRTLDN